MPRLNNRLLRGVVLAFICAMTMVGCSKNKTPTQLAMGNCNGDPYLAKFGCDVANVQQAASSGDPDAQYALGYMYFYGVGTVQDTQTAKLWIARAAAQGQPLAKKAISLLNQGHTPGAYMSDMNHEPSGIEKHLPNLNSGSSRPPVLNVLKRHPQYEERQPIHNINSAKHLPSSPSVHQIRHIGRSAIDRMEGKLMHMSAKGYTLQLMGNHHLPTIQRYVKAHHLEGKAVYYYSTFHHSRWYMLTYGQYKTVAEAHRAIQQLPKSVRANHPWIKPIKDVQAEIKTRELVS